MAEFMKNQEGLRKKVLKSFVERLHQRQGDNLLKVVLFGSVARGDDGPDSDIDVFVLLKEQNPADKHVEEIVDISYDVDFDEGNGGTYISPFVRLLDEYEKGLKRGVPVYQAIQKEGRVLYDAQIG